MCQFNDIKVTDTSVIIFSHSQLSLMPRVVPEYKEEAKKRILEVATRIVLEKGYQHVRMDDIAREAGISRPTLYLYYKNKEALFLEIVRSIIADIGSMAQETIQFGEIQSFEDFFSRANERYKDQFAIIFEVMTGLPKKHMIISEISRLHEGMIAQIARFLSMRFPDHPMSSDPEILANAMLAMFIGLQIRQKLGLDPEKASKVWEMVIPAQFQHDG